MEAALLRTLEKLADVLGFISSFVARVMLVLVAAILFLQVVLRYGFGFSLPWPEEAARYLMIWVVMLAGSLLVKDEQLVVRDIDGSEVISNSQVTVAVTEQVKPGALVTVWPGAAGERTAKVIRIDRHDDLPPLPSFLVLSLE